MPATNLFAHSTNSNTDEPKKSDAKAAKKVIIATKANDEVVPIPPTPLLPPLPPMISTPVKVTGIKPIPLAPEKFAKMGLAKKEDGSVTFSQKNENGKIMTMGFPKNSWGIIIGGKALENAVIDAPRFAPLIVTDTKGNKRLMQFSSEKNGVKKRGIQIISRDDRSESDTGNMDMKELNEFIKNDPKKLQELMKIVGKIKIGNKDGDTYLNLKLDSNDAADIHEPMQFEMKFDSKIDTTNTDGIRSDRREKNGMSFYSETDSSNSTPKRKIIMKMNKTISFDSTMINLDSTMQNSRDAVERAEKKLNEVISKMHLEKLDSLVGNLKNLDLEDENFDNIDKDIAGADADMAALEQRANELNNLIPILVRSATSEHVNKEEGITYDDGLIFWYNPEKDLLDAVPEAQNSVSPASNNVSKIISNAVLYPNPTKNKTTLRFSLSEPRTVAFSIHDLLGKRVLDGGSIPETSAGSFEKELNVAELTEGVYLLVITTDKGEQNMQRLVIKK